MRRNVLILHQGALGDFVLTWPLAMAMGRIFPQSRIIYITPREKGRLAERAIRVESGDIELGWHALFAETPNVPETVAKLLAGAHTIFSFISQPGDVVARNLATAAPDAKLFHMSTRQLPRDGHVTQWLIDDLQSFPAGAEAVRQMLRSIADRGLGIRRPLTESVTIHPGSGSPEKNWPAEKFIELASQLRAAGKSVQILLGEVELERWPRDLIAKFEAAGQVARPQSYLELYELLTRTTTFIGNDSGPGHLAGMMGVPTITLFVSTAEDVWHPVGPNRESMAGVSTAADAVRVVDTIMSRSVPKPMTAIAGDD